MLIKYAIIHKLWNTKRSRVLTKCLTLCEHDSKNKLDLGLKWEADAGISYKYFMVFEHNRIDDAVDVQELLEILKGMC